MKNSFKFLILDPETPGALMVLKSFNVFSYSSMDANIMTMLIL
jgi:hypothetical protein